MKQILFAFLFAMMAMEACKTNNNEFTIEGTVKQMGDGEIFFIAAGDDQKPDTVKVKGDKFSFKGKVTEPTVYMINFGADKQPGFIIVEPGKTTLTYESNPVSGLEVKGGKEQTLYSGFLQTCKPIFSQMDSLGKVASQHEGDDAMMAQLQGRFTELESQLKNTQLNFIKSNKSSVATAFIGANYINEKMDATAQEVDEIYNALDPKIKESYFGKQLAKRSQQMKGTSIGQPAPAFELKDANGNMVSLNSFKGSVTLIDFWASWCGPCRQENPNVVAAYGQFKSKGFKILGVSLDSEKDNWLDAIEKDKLTWTHVSDLKGWNSDVAASYGVQSIPMNFLLDKEGKIIAKDLRGEALIQKLNEVIQ